MTKDWASSPLCLVCDVLGRRFDYAQRPGFFAKSPSATLVCVILGSHVGCTSAPLSGDRSATGRGLWCWARGQVEVFEDGVVYFRINIDLMRVFVFALVLGLGFSSCQQRLYFPDRVNSPLLTKGLEGKLTVAVKPQINDSDSGQAEGSPFSTGIDAAFSPINHLGLIASFRSINKRRIDEDYGSYVVDQYGGVFDGHRWELGAGYFSSFGKGRAEVYGGLGFGKLSRRGTSSPERDYDTRYNRQFLQGGIGTGNDIFLIGGGFRFAMMQFREFTSPNTPDLRYRVLGAYRDVQDVNFIFMEPYVTAEVGWKVIKFNMQVGTSVQMSGDKIAGNTPFFMSLGAVFHFDPDYTKTGGLMKR
jgi:hypothetical protein